MLPILMPETALSRGPMGSGYWKLLTASTISNLGDGVGLIAYPWLASAVTRNPLLISIVAVVQRLPWLLFSLPAGVLTDRRDRRLLMVGSNVARAAITLTVALVVLARRGVLPGPDQIEAGTVPENLGLYGLILVATFLLGTAEVIHDNAGQTILPSIVEKSDLERANGRLTSTELVANTLIGPPLGAFLLVLAFSVPFLVDATTFALAAVLVALIPAAAVLGGGDQPARADTGPSEGDDLAPSWRQDLAEGFRWLWAHDLFRSLAVILGLMNLLGMVSAAAFVLFAQEVLSTSPTEFALLGTGAAVGGILGGVLAERVTERIGPGRSLALTLVGGGLTSLAIGATSQWPVAWLLMGAFMFLAVLWNVITVSLRQAVIPDRLLGRVNSVYRFFAWGMMPVGGVLGGLIVAVSETFTDREMALRMPWFVAGIGWLALLGFAAPRLTIAKIEAARAAAHTP